MSNKKEKIKGVIGTIIYHLLVLSVLLFFGLTTPLPLPGEEGVEVNIGNSDQGSGVIQQAIPEEVSQASEKKEEVAEKKQEEKVVELPPEKPVVKEKIVEEKIIQQETEETPAIIKPEKKKEEVKEEKTVPVVNPNALYKKREPVEKPVEKVPEPVVNPNALYKKPSGTNQGVAGGTGDQGQVHGTPESVNYEGLGGEGSGISYSLEGRGAKVIPKPTYTSPEQGRVVVNIWVNREGLVVKADDGAKGTNISDINLRRLAREAALQAKFSENPSAPDLQRGTITYNFIRIN
ncbi:MAG: hypothetical protein KKG99_08975 [Bacteroidetes bacterium]|nr:hypothetical protein [Bacteroidota bacterium]